jgi:UDP:flavonoid glycosyltransferase YjiC (YdhE family)
MRVLMTSWAWPSHYLPMVPLGWALRAAGHEVRVASQPALGKVIIQSGQVAVATGPDLDHAEVHQRVMRGQRLTAVPDAPPPGGSTLDWAPEARERLRRVFGVFAAYAEAMLDDLHAYAREWRPDLIVFDPTTLAAPLVGAALGIPAVRHIHGVDVTYQARDIMAELLVPLAARLGVTGVDPLGAATVDPCPPSMQIPNGTAAARGTEPAAPSTGVIRLTTRYVPYNGPELLPAWLREPPRRTRVCVTWGTSTTRLAGFGHFAPPLVLAALDELDQDLEVVLAVTGEEADTLAGLPGRVRVARGLPLHLLLPRCAALVHQGGNGTLLTGVYHGIPQLVLPQLPDQAFHTGRFVTTGAGLGLRTPQATADAVRTAVGDLLADSRYQMAAHRLRAEMHAAPPPAQIVPALLSLAGQAGR